MIKFTIKESLLKVAAGVAYKEAEINANSVCVFIHNQPQVPEKVKSLRKF